MKQARTSTITGLSTKEDKASDRFVCDSNEQIILRLIKT